MNKKRFFAIILSFIMCILSSCTLIDNSNQNSSTEFKITDDFLVGMFLYVEKWDSSKREFIPYPTNDFDDENAISLYCATKETAGFTYKELISSEYLSDNAFAISNLGTNISEDSPYGKIDLKATFIYTYELIHSTFFVSEVYERNGKKEYYVLNDSYSGYYLNAFSGLSLTKEQNITVSKTDSDGTIKELKYDGKYTVDVKFIDYLMSAKVIEFDANHNVIKTEIIDLYTDDFLSYQTQTDCEYIFIEENYEIMHNLDNYNSSEERKYTERYFFNKSKTNQYHSFYAPLGNGFVKNIRLKISFHGTN